ncbi:hypothetical protein [Gloeobacter morelensis]|uniref:Secreted protein n=1 Tax=Gloeobacter morelensis MG652769 TaxID=2781736 RepID=A0ABY3PPJ9_9CYAN|nr:hypothetical protein [Gloeobacter morelensis]UFP95571.1 hypothetical protein ISF26_04815 [Gloeobacter morelensis MG652769]
MSKRIYLFAIVAALLVPSVVGAQGMLMDMVANKVIDKYQSSTCDQLKTQKNEPPSAKEKKAIQLLRDDPQARTAFLNKVAGPITNKMFECGMIP